MICTYQKSDGSTCNREAISDRGLCILHEDWEHKGGEETMRALYAEIEKGVSDFEGSVVLDIDLCKRTLPNGINFRRASIRGGVYLDEAKIEKYWLEKERRVIGATCFEEATIDGCVSLDEAIVDGSVNFGKATIGDDVTFQKAAIKGDVNFCGATIGHGATFTSATIDGSAMFYYATIERELDLEEAVIKKWLGLKNQK